MVLYNVFIGPLAHVMHTCIPDGETLLRDVFHKVHPKCHLLLVVARSKGERYLKIVGVHHVFVPACKVVGDALQQSVDFGGDGDLGNNDSYWI